MLELALSISLPLVINSILGLFFWKAYQRERQRLKDFYKLEKEEALKEYIEPMGQSLEGLASILGKFGDGTLSRAMSIMGIKSGEARQEISSRNKFEHLIEEGVPIVKYAKQLGEKFGIDIEASDLLNWLNDPKVGPMIGQFLGGQVKTPNKASQLSEWM